MIAIATNTSLFSVLVTENKLFCLKVKNIFVLSFANIMKLSNTNTPIACLYVCCSFFIMYYPPLPAIGTAIKHAIVKSKLTHAMLNS